MNEKKRKKEKKRCERVVVNEPVFPGKTTKFSPTPLGTMSDAEFEAVDEMNSPAKLNQRSSRR
jgi:hypothetical protein